MRIAHFSTNGQFPVHACPDVDSCPFGEIPTLPTETELDDYEKFCATTDLNLGRDYPADMYYALELANEAGEVAGKIKKAYRDGVLDVRALEQELGDVLWPLARLANFHGLTLRGVLAANIEKLSSRQERGKLHGSGDNR